MSLVMFRGHWRRVVACCLLLCGIFSIGFAQNSVRAEVNETSVNSFTRVAQSAISLGAGHSCAIVDGGSIKCWGRNDYGQLGDNTLSLRQNPIGVTGGTESFTQLALGEYFSCALSSSSRVFCWGRNTNGQLGLSNTVDKKTITSSVISLSNVASISAGNNFACAIVGSSTSQVKCWGQNSDGQLGIGSLVSTMAPTSNVSLSGEPVAISAGIYHTCALLTDGNVQCWGQNQFGQVGNGTNIADVPAPVGVVPLAGPARAISSGANYSCALLTDGNVQCWGQNSGGKLGNNSNTNSFFPVTVQGFSNSIATDPVIGITAGQGHTCALTQNRNLYCWGRNNDGELGDGTNTQRWVATPVNTGSGVVAAVTTGNSHSCLTMTSGSVQCWGSDQYGQLGNGGGGSTSSPTEVSGPLTGVGVSTTMPPSTSAVSTTSSTTVVATGEPSTNTISSNGSNATTETTASGNSNEIKSENGLGGETTSSTPIRSTTLEPKRDVDDRRIESQQFVILSAIITVLAISTTTSSTSQQGFNGKELIAHRRRRRDEKFEDPELIIAALANLSSENSSEKRRLSQEFKELSNVKQERGGLAGIFRYLVGTIFRMDILLIQQLSRIRLFRPGLKRWAEIAIVAPIVAAAIPVVVFFGACVTAFQLSQGRLSMAIALVIVFLLVVSAPFFAVVGIAGWALGRLLGASSFEHVISEVLILQIGLLFAPITLRSVIGPIRKCSQLEYRESLIVAPLLGLVFFWKWSEGFSEAAQSMCVSLPGNCDVLTSGWVTQLSTGSRTPWLLPVVMTALVFSASLIAIRMSDYYGHPFPIIPARHKHDDLKHLLRHEYAENLELELGEPSLWNKLARYCLAGVAMTFGLYEFVGWFSVAYAIFFLLATYLLQDLRVVELKNEIHPINRIAPFVAFGIGISYVLVDVLSAHFAISAIGVVCVGLLLLKPRPLW